MGILAAILAVIIGNAGLFYFSEHFITEQMFETVFRVPIVLGGLEILILIVCWGLYKQK